MGRGTVRSFGVNGLVVRICMLYGLLSNTFCQPHVSHKTGMRTSMGTGIGDRDGWHIQWGLQMSNMGMQGTAELWVTQHMWADRVYPYHTHADTTIEYKYSRT